MLMFPFSIIKVSKKNIYFAIFSNVFVKLDLMKSIENFLRKKDKDFRIIKDLTMNQESEL